jgi:uncharacterized phage protein gp47/JayE
MSVITRVWTQEQLVDLWRNYILAKCGLYDFNPGSVVQTLLEFFCGIISTLLMEGKESIYKAIPVALYEGFKFEKKSAINASGFIRPYRKAAMMIEYTGTGTSALLTTTSTNMSTQVIGAPGDAFDLAYATYPKTSDLVTAIDALSNWSATVVKDVNADTLYLYTNEEIIGKKNYLNADGLDIMLATDIAIIIPEGFSCSLDNEQITTTETETILAGTSGVQCAARFGIPGPLGNIGVNALDTANGKGSINSVIDGVENVINDSAFASGQAAETDAERELRFREFVNALNAGTRLGILSAIRSVDGVRSVGLVENFPDKGTNTVIVDDGSGSGTIDPTILANVNKVLYGDPDDRLNFPGKNVPGITYDIEAPVLVDVDIDITIYRYPNVNISVETVKSDVQTALERYVNTRQLGEDVILSEISRQAKNANAGVWDVSIAAPAANIVINNNEFSKTGAGTSGTVTVTVVIASTI